MRDDDRRAPQVVQKIADTPGDRGEILATRTFELPQATGGLIAGLRRNLVPGQALPLAKINLLQPCIKPDVVLGPENQMRGLSRPPLGAAENGVRLNTMSL